MVKNGAGQFVRRGTMDSIVYLLGTKYKTSVKLFVKLWAGRGERIEFVSVSAGNKLLRVGMVKQ